MSFLKAGKSGLRVSPLWVAVSLPNSRGKEFTTEAIDNLKGVSSRFVHMPAAETSVNHPITFVLRFLASRNAWSQKAELMILSHTMQIRRNPRMRIISVRAPDLRQLTVRFQQEAPNQSHHLRRSHRVQDQRRTKFRQTSMMAVGTEVERGLIHF